jgi:amino acid transporter
MEQHHDKNEIDKIDPITETTLENDADEEIRARVAVSVNHRRLNPRQIQLTAIAGSIGAALFVAIGSGVLSGPLCLLIGLSLL